jgi:hypothetical protein
VTTLLSQKTRTTTTTTTTVGANSATEAFAAFERVLSGSPGVRRVALVLDANSHEFPFRLTSTTTEIAETNDPVGY